MRCLTAFVAILVISTAAALAQAKGQHPFDGRWVLSWLQQPPDCTIVGAFSTPVRIVKGAIEGRVKTGRVSGSVDASGAAEWEYRTQVDGAPMRFQGTLRDKTGSGVFHDANRRCQGSFTAKRL